VAALRSHPARSILALIDKFGGERDPVTEESEELSAAMIIRFIN
jgi:hypothetical protein